jgi:hypothetical protein
LLARPAVDPNRGESGRVRARNVADEAVADHDRIVGSEVERSQRRFKDAWIGFPDGDLGGDDRGFEQRRKRGVRELLTLDVRRAVGYEREPVVAREIAQHRVGVWIGELRPAPRGNEILRRGFDPIVIPDPDRGQSAAPHPPADGTNERIVRSPSASPRNSPQSASPHQIPIASA